MRQTKALKAMLEDLSAVFNDGQQIDVAFAKPGEASSADFEGKIKVSPNVRQDLGRDLDGPDELRVIIDALSHEVEHVRESELTGKQAFAEEFPFAPELAGAVINIVEDQYVDWRRTSRFKGLRPSRAFVIDTLMRNHSRRPRIDKLPKPLALLEGLFQVSFAGYAKHIQEADPEVREFLGWARERVDDARREPDPEKREQAARDIFNRLLAHIESKDEMEMMRQAVSNLPVKETPDIDLDDLTEEEIQQMLDELLNDPDRGSDFDGQEIDIDAALENMDDIDASPRMGAASSWYGVDSPETYKEPDQQDIQRYDELQRRIQQKDTGLDALIRDRNGLIEVAEEEEHYDRGEAVREDMRDDDLAYKIEQAFRELKTRDRFEQRRTGQRVNTRAYTRLKSGNNGARRELYVHRDVAELGDRTIHVCIDLSGSMNYSSAMRALVATQIATEAIRDEFSANGFSTRFDGNVQLITAPNEDFEWDHLNAAPGGGGTPTAAGIQQAIEVLDHSSKPEQVMVVITDGHANRNLAGGGGRMSSRNDAASMVRVARRKGIKVIGLAVDMDAESLQPIFGEHVLSTNMDRLPQTLIKIYNAQMKTGEAQLG